LIAAVAALVLANALFALRSLDVILRSRDRIKTSEPDPSLPPLSIVVPARNEERQVERCIRSLLAQRHPDFEVILVDDRSEDRTRAIADRLARDDPRLKVLAGEPLPEGWVGKSWALAQGARAARGAWMLFTDADTEHEPLAAASAARCAIDRSYDVVSLLTDQETIGIAERVFLPTILFTILLGIGALDDINDPRKPQVAIFNGQYILVSRAAYEAIGGHAAVGAEIAEDLELARRFKRDGRFRTLLAGAGGLVRTRMYRSFGEIWEGFVKNFALGARGNPARAAAGVTLLTCVSPLTPLTLLALLATRRWSGAAALALSTATVSAIAELGLRRMRFRRGSGLALPVGLSVVLAIFATSAARMLSGRGVRWRGRRYDGGFHRPSW
jgi:chlorobactene glucosyltransferase